MAYTYVVSTLLVICVVGSYGKIENLKVPHRYPASNLNSTTTLLELSAASLVLGVLAEIKHVVH